MKKLFVFAVMVITIGECFGQENAHSGAPDLQIIKNGWEKVRLNWERDPLSTPAGENFYQLRDRVSTERRQRSALEERSMKAAKEENQKPAPPPRYVFTYKITVQNAGAKAIKELDWDYIFTDAITGEILGRREFTSVEKIGAGKRKELTITVSAPPASRISVYSLGKNENEGLVAKVVVSRVMYEDGTLWQSEQR